MENLSLPLFPPFLSFHGNGDTKMDDTVFVLEKLTHSLVGGNVVLRRYTETPNKGLSVSLGGNPRRPPKKKVTSKLSPKIQLGVEAGRQSGEWGEGIQGKCEQR